MKGRIKDYVEDNRRAYQYYLRVPGGHKGHMLLSGMVLILISLIIFWTRHFVLKFCFLIEAINVDLGMEEVRDWVDIQVELYDYNGAFWWLIGTTIFVIVWVVLVYTKIKSYELYKMQKRLILPPIFAYGMLVIVIVYYSRVNRYSCVLAIQIFVEMIPIFSAFKLFLPLDMREGYENILFLFEWLSNCIIKRM